MLPPRQMNWFRHIARRVRHRASRARVWHEKIGSILICLLPLVLIIDVRNAFSVDWFNHLWIIEYFGEYIRRHGSVPRTLVTKELVGIAMPIFYGGKFYAASGVISSFLGSAVAFRIVAFLAVFSQFWHVERAVYSAAQKKSLSFAAATLVSWAIYPLTNLYNRSALTEFISVAFLTAAVGSIFVLVFRLSTGHRSYYDAVAFGLLYVAAALTHPLTALFGGVFLISIGLGAWFALRRPWLAIVGVFNLATAALVLSPWCYVVHRFGRSLPLTDPTVIKGWFRKDGFFPGSIDNFWSRLSPVPVDFRSILKGIDVSTPYLDAQIILPLGILACGLGWIWFRSVREIRPGSKLVLTIILCLSIVWFLVFLAVSVNPSLSGVFGGFFDILQFPYRLTTYVNLASLTCVFALAGLISSDSADAANNKSRFETILIAGCLIISFFALVAKLIHAEAALFYEPYSNLHLHRLNHDIGPQPPPNTDETWYPGILAPNPWLINLPPTFYGYFGYTVTAGFSTARPPGSYAEQAIAFPPNTSQHFGTAHPIHLELTSPTLIVTNAHAFPWNRLVVDGVEQKSGTIFAVESEAFAKWMKPVVQAVLLSKGTHVLEYRFRPDSKWRVLDEISWAVLLLWVALWVFAACVRRRRTKVQIEDRRTRRLH